MGGVVGNAVKHGFVVGVFTRRQQAGEVDPAEDFAGRGCDARDAIGMPDVGVDLAMDEFEFVELGDGFAVVLDGDAAGFVKGGWGRRSGRCGAVAEDEVVCVVGKAPAFVVDGERAQKAERGAVVDKRDVRLPGELDERRAPVGEAFGEVLAGHVVQLEDAAGLEVFFAEGRLAFDAGAFVEVSIDNRGGPG